MKSDDVYIDLLTDSGTSAMSDRQWAGMMLGDEAYAGSRNFYHLEEAIQTVYGYKHIVPTHQGRGAEHLISQAAIKKGQYVPGNMYFTTTRLHQEMAGGIFVDVIIDEAHDPINLHPFKGNIDLNKVQALIDREGADNIAYISLAGTVNMAGGQPVSMANVKALRELCSKHGIKIFLDATRMMENAFFIQEREEGYANKSIAEILKEFCAYTDGAWMSAKKDNLVNIGGWLAVNDWDLFEELRNMVVIFEGLHTYGGLAGRDMEAMAIGITEAVQDDHIRSRIGQVRYLGELLTDWGMPIMHARGRPRHLPRCASASIRTCRKACSRRRRWRPSCISIAASARWSAAWSARDAIRIPAITTIPKLELTRLTIPRRVYTQAHMDVVAESVKAVYDRANQRAG